MIGTQTKEPTDMINNQSDTNMSGTGIGSSAPNINLDDNSYKSQPYGSTRDSQYNDKGKETKDPFSPYSLDTTGLEGLETLQRQIEEQQKELQETLIPREEKETTQGQHETNLLELNKEQEYLENALNTLNNFNWGNIKDQNLLIEIMEKYGNEEWKKQAEKDWNGLKGKELENAIKNSIYELAKNNLTNVKDNIYNIKNKSDYDPRSDEQIREDEKDSTAYQTVVEDMRKAGINPASISNAGYAGGGGGGSSSKEDEEKEKRRRKKREELERLRMQQQEEMRKQQQVLQIIGMLTGVGSMLGGGMVRNIGYNNFWQSQINKQSNKEALKVVKKEPAWLDKYLKEIENMG